MKLSIRRLRTLIIFFSITILLFLTFTFLFKNSSGEDPGFVDNFGTPKELKNEFDISIENDNDNELADDDFTKGMNKDVVDNDDNDIINDDLFVPEYDNKDDKKKDDNNIENDNKEDKNNEKIDSNIKDNEKDKDVDKIKDDIDDVTNIDLNNNKDGSKNVDDDNIDKKMIDETNIDDNKKNEKEDEKEVDDKGNDKNDDKNDNKKENNNQEKDVEFKLYHFGPNYRDSDDPEGKECPVKWKWTNEKSESDIIVLNVLDNFGEIKNIEDYKYDKERQKLLLMSMESTTNYDFMITKKKYFDYTIDYRLDSDVPIPYTYGFFDFSKQPLPIKKKGKDGRGLAAVFISNCSAANKRLEFLQELMKYTKIDSYGICENNKDIYDEDDDNSSWDVKMNTIRKYKFTLAFENSNDRDYVTEKFFQPLEVGSVPVFYGTSNIADFAPEHSFIDANEFHSAKELAKYLEYLDKNDKEYEKYLEWKKKAKDGDFGDNLNHLIEIRKLNSICQLLQRIKGMWINPYLTIWDRKDVPKDERACRLC